MTDRTALGDRMKDLERRETDRRLLPRLPILARVDGRGFSKFTRGMERPYDPRMSRCMRETARGLVERTAALAAYTQSDEISLLWLDETDISTAFFDGRVQKLASVLAGLATVSFNEQVAAVLPTFADRLPHFDARAWAVPTREDAADAFLWRERDATKNSVSMAARAFYSHEELHGRSGREMQDLLMGKGVNWNDFPPFFKRGVFLRRIETRRTYDADELDVLPPKHRARTDPGLEVVRHRVEAVDVPPFGKVTNRAGFLFSGEPPETAAA
ncbi:tRNA(His) guanylyltransferase Thg1 family protein [Alienimonas californiensis]|uniref:tRNAHis guanylyltransferase n=1 Tax=Alienimonas californiensis TaxID=2527989 RepID=A0A517P6J6_9PLAN|nr:tRNA(His) guanylyltransferase Thg1 family protein [Alienimonas californiensis]QDT14984.1 tRNAHis guanylyltransferase [Alienimonas californiensis]